MGASYDSHVASISLAKDLGRGLFTEGGGVSFRLGYAFTDSNNFRNVGSSTATSNFDVTAAFDRQDPAISTSNFETRHNIVASVFLREAFFEDYSTGLGIFFRATEGRPYSLTFDGGGVFNDSSSGSDNALLYVPTGVGDPNVSPDSDPAAVAALVDYVANQTDCDFTPGSRSSATPAPMTGSRISTSASVQELPFVGRLTGITTDRIELFADFDNFLNLIDSGENIFRTRGDFVDVVDGGGGRSGPLHHRRLQPGRSERHRHLQFGLAHPARRALRVLMRPIIG